MRFSQLVVEKAVNNLQHYPVSANRKAPKQNDFRRFPFAIFTQIKGFRDENSA
jgi:hypothetical protein